jgi:CDGSH-type Zn-finger protein
MGKQKITISKDGPYIVSGGVPLQKENAEVCGGRAPEVWVAGEVYPAKEHYSLCRCGASATKPYCDGTHTTAKFDGTETADRTPFLDIAEKIEGPGLDLLDVLPLCSGARFCEPGGSIWNLVPKSADPAAKSLAIREACDCPSGRLVACDKESGLPIEPNFPPSISVTEDIQVGLSGPLWVKGGIPVESSDGTVYETRNRVTLCRCGSSLKKPFCDGNHLLTGFNDGDESLVEPEFF